MSKTWGWHYRFNGVGDPRLVKDGKNIEAFVRTLVPAIDMIPYGDPVVVHFAEHNPHAAGYTLSQLIMTSNISGHFVDDTGEIFIDIFSCKDFNSMNAFNIIKQFFGVEDDFNHDFISRSAGKISDYYYFELDEFDNEYNGA